MEDKEKEVTEVVTENEELLQNEENVEVEEFTDTEEGKEQTSEEDVKKEDESEKLYTKAEMDAEIERISKERETRAYKKSERKAQKEIDKYKGIVNTLKVGMGKDNLDELSNSLKDFYKEQGIDIPEKNSLSEKEETILAKAYAQEIIELGEDEINEVASTIYNKPLERRTTREKVIFNELGQYMMNKKAEDDLRSKGIDINVLQDTEFKKFASKFSSTTALSEIYDMYSKINSNREAEKRIAPPSTGSVRNTAKSIDKYREDYTPEEVEKISMDELNDPKLMRAVERSMQKWK